MQYLQPQLSEDVLRVMAKEAAGLFLNGTLTPTDAVIKVASTRAGLTDQHVRRVCEMTYHDIFERSFQGSPGPERLISFDPPDAEKVAAAVRAEQVQSFHDKVAASQRKGASMDKTAELSRVPHVPAAKNAFLASVVTQDREPMKKEATSLLRQVREELVEAERDLQVQLASAAGSAKLAFFDLSRDFVDTLRNGTHPVLATTACVEFAKTAGVDDTILEALATDLFNVARRAGYNEVLHQEKTASYDRLLVNDRHPLRANAMKIAEFRGFKVHGEAALSDIREQRARLERELQDALYQ